MEFIALHSIVFRMAIARIVNAPQYKIVSEYHIAIIFTLSYTILSP